MFVTVQYFKEQFNAYAGKEYTFKTDLDLVEFQKVLVPTNKKGEFKKALVRRINVKWEDIDPDYRDNLKTITQIDKGENLW